MKLKMKQPVAVTEVEWFEHVPKGEKPRVFKGSCEGIPGDGCFASVNVQGMRFAVSVVSMGNEGVKPEAFELALRSTVAALCSAVGAEQERGVEVVPDSAIN